MRRVLGVVAFLLGLSGLTGCAHVNKDPAICPEYREMRCVGEPICSMSSDRGCKVCQCEEMDLDTPPPGSSPDDPSLPPE